MVEREREIYHSRAAISPCYHPRGINHDFHHN
jgi:hypothetical protein